MLRNFLNQSKNLKSLVSPDVLLENPDVLLENLENPDVLLENPDVLLENPDVLLENPEEEFREIELKAEKINRCLWLSLIIKKLPQTLSPWIY